MGIHFSDSYQPKLTRGLFTLAIQVYNVIKIWRISLCCTIVSMSNFLSATLKPIHRKTDIQTQLMGALISKQTEISIQVQRKGY